MVTATAADNTPVDPSGAEDHLQIKIQFSLCGDYLN
jgi:hypothetical protein